MICTTTNAAAKMPNITNNQVIYLLATVLATITSIGIVVMAVKGVKKAFGIFFGKIR